MAVIRRRILISGRVQGVGFRYSACQHALELGLAGWVRNLPNGQVEALVDGELNTVEAMTDWCRRGPRFARVDSVWFDEETLENPMQEFQIR